MAPKKIQISKLLYNQLYPEKTAEVIKDDLDKKIYVRKISRGDTEELVIYNFSKFKFVYILEFQNSDSFFFFFF